MGFLKGKRCYLSGPIEYDQSGQSHNWRTEPRNILDTFGVDLFDPFADDKQMLTVPLEGALAREDYETVRQIAKRFVRKDLAWVDRADFVVACVPKAVPTVGTVHEIVFSDSAKKPTLLVCPQGKRHAGKWYFGIIDHNHIFGSWGDLHKYLKEVDEGKHQENDRWAFVYGLV